MPRANYFGLSQTKNKLVCPTVHWTKYFALEQTKNKLVYSTMPRTNYYYYTFMQSSYGRQHVSILISNIKHLLIKNVF